MVGAHSRDTELSRLLSMNVLKEVEDEPPSSCTLQTRYVYLPGQQLAPVYWHDQLTRDLQRADLIGNPACPVVYGGKDQAATVHVDDGLIGDLETPVNNTAEILKEKYKLERSAPLKEVGDQVRFLKRTLEVIPEALQIHIDPKYVEKVVGREHLRNCASAHAQASGHSRDSDIGRDSQAGRSSGISESGSIRMFVVYCS